MTDSASLSASPRIAELWASAGLVVSVELDESPLSTAACERENTHQGSGNDDTSRINQHQRLPALDYRTPPAYFTLPTRGPPRAVDGLGARIRGKLAEPPRTAKSVI